ncbi:hypothetical protein K439DRAFT_1633845, partial [Ramaria rubella]
MLPLSALGHWPILSLSRKDFFDIIHVYLRSYRLQTHPLWHWFLQVSLRVSLPSAAPFYALSLVSFASLCILLPCLTCLRSAPLQDFHQPQPPKALLRVLIPRCSIWPQYYTSLTNSPQSRTLTLSLSILIQDLISGKIELRHPEDTLERLISSNGTLQIDDHDPAWQLRFSHARLWVATLWRWSVWSVFPQKYTVSTRGSRLTAYMRI